MIQYIISDLDGTLFEGHGESVFDLAKENIDALLEAKGHGIRVLPCSGRSIPYSLRLYELYKLGNPVIAAGLNGSVIYDEGLVKTYQLDGNDVMEMIRITEKYPDKFYNMQAQDLWEQRIYYYPNEYPAPMYREASGKDKCSTVSDIPLTEFIKNGGEIGKFSIGSNTIEDSKFMEDIIRTHFESSYTITRSSSTFLEVNHKLANKGRFVAYIKDKYQLKSDEIAVIGDNHNDSFMYSESEHTFAMARGDMNLQAQARYVVDSVAECIKMCIMMNENKQE